MSDIEPRDMALAEFEKEHPDQINKGVQYKSAEFDHAMLRKWPDGRLCVSRLNRKKNAWVFVRNATVEDIERIRKMLGDAKKAQELFGAEKK